MKPYYAVMFALLLASVRYASSTVQLLISGAYANNRFLGAHLQQKTNDMNATILIHGIPLALAQLHPATARVRVRR